MNYSEFSGLYPLSKTLRFELKPIGKTKENIEKNGILERDNERAIAYKAVKKVIDEYSTADAALTPGLALYLKRLFWNACLSVSSSDL